MARLDEVGWEGQTKRILDRRRRTLRRDTKRPMSKQNGKYVPEVNEPQVALSLIEMGQVKL